MRMLLCLGEQGAELSLTQMPTLKVRSIAGLSCYMPSTNIYLGVVGTVSSSASDSDVKVTEVWDKGKRKAGERLEWSSDEDDAYERFKNRKATKRKKLASTKQKWEAKAKDATANRKEAKENGGSTGRKKEKSWGEESDYDIDDTVPGYLRNRRQQFDRNHQVLQEAGLRLPPGYDGMDFSDDERLGKLEERPKFSITVEPSRQYKDIELPHSAGIIPASIARYLRDYQVEGVAFLHELFVYQKGGILGDDMGLGKTVQVAAFLIVAFGKTGDARDAKRMRKMRRAEAPWYPRVLIVCPATLMSNWATELARWGWWHVDIFHGNHKDDVLQAATSGRLEIMITTYKTYSNHRSQLNLIRWDCVVVDEVHTLKERTSDITQSMQEVNALCRIGLTGTAIQNKYEELWTLLNWTNPGRFGPLLTWKNSISEPLRLGQS